MLRLLVLLTCLIGGGCSSNAGRIDALARGASLERSVLEIDGLSTSIYMRPDLASGQALVVFLEGDGRPWRAGIEPSRDPTTSNPLALELLTRTPRAAAYVSRPCYQGVASARCSPALWTSDRYSQEIVETMTHTIRELMRRSNANETILVGHSGGGTLAVLIAERMAGIKAVVTIAANLDIDAWTAHHEYLPLSGSLNPARSRLAHPWQEIHLAGARDQVVPIETTSAYFDRYPNAERWVLDEHAHACCWVDAWPALWEKIESELTLE